MKPFCVLVGILLKICAVLTVKELDLWQTFKSDYNISFGSVQDENYRLKTFSDNLALILRHNELFDKGETSFKMGINQFADMTFEEISRMNEINESLTEVPADSLYDPIVFESSDDYVPDSFDWRDYGAVAAAKNQLKCGSCYAMATVASIESQVYFKTGKLVELSVQEIVDCAGSFQTFGCDGGIKFRVYDFVKANRGIVSQKHYPYTGEQGECKSSKLSKAHVAVNLNAYVEVPPNDENLLKLALFTVGPIAVSINSDNESFIRYSSGIYYEPNCTRDVNHAALLVGYGSENGHDFWIVRNSYGDAWGEKGFIRMARNRDNHCGIASDSLYPVID